MSGEVREVWGAYHERERLCPEGVRVVEIAHVHYDALDERGHPHQRPLTPLVSHVHVYIPYNVTCQMGVVCSVQCVPTIRKGRLRLIE